MNKLGGLSGKAKLVAELRKKSQHVLLVDSGNLLAPRIGISTERDHTIAAIKAEGILRAYQIMGYDGVGIGGADLTYLPISPDSSVSQHTLSMPFLSANLIKPISAQTVIRSHDIRQFDGFKVGIVGLTGKIDIPAESGYSLTDWQTSFATVYEKLHQNCDLIVVLSSLAENENSILAAKFPQIGVIISALPKRSNLAPKIVNNTLITQAGAQGKNLGRIDLHYQRNGNWTGYTQPKLEVLHSRLQAVDWQIDRLRKGKSSLQPDQTPDDRLKKLQEYRQQLLAMIASQQKEDDKARQIQVFENTFAASVLDIKPANSSGKVAALVEDMHRAIKN